MKAETMSLFLTDKQFQEYMIDRIAARVVDIMDERRTKGKIVVVTQIKAFRMYGKSVIQMLLKRNFLRSIELDNKTMVDSEGGMAVMRKGAIYYRIDEIDRAINAAAATKYKQPLVSMQPE